MNKISGILPANPRLTSVNLQEARPLRAGGGPTFGIPVALTSRQEAELQKMQMDKALNPTDFFEPSNEGKMKQMEMQKQIEQNYFNRESLGTSGVILSDTEKFIPETGLGPVSVRA
jgi:hypothetical protein